MRFLFFLLLCCSALRAQEPVSAIGRMITCETHDTVVGAAYVPPPARVVNGAELTATFNLIYTSSVPADARESMQFAADVWGSYLQSDVPIRVEIDWRDEEDDRLLASAGPSTIVRDFSGAPERQTWYPVALAEALFGDTINAPDEADIVVVVNSTANWYYGTDGNTPRNRIDLATVFMHEMGHGLGILSSVDSIGTDSVIIGYDNRFLIYDTFLETPPGRQLTDIEEFNNPSQELLAAIIDELDFGGEKAVEKNDGELVPLFAPETFDVGSSVSHLEESVYRTGTINALMTPSLASGEAIHDPGPVTLGIMFDLGWPLSFEASVATHEIVAGRLGVYPNPASGSFTLELGDVLSPTVAILYAPDGREASRQDISGQYGGTARVSVDHLAPGIYTLFVPDGDRAFSGRVVVR